jgi:hypothetical protein
MRSCVVCLSSLRSCMISAYLKIRAASWSAPYCKIVLYVLGIEVLVG